MWRLGRTRVSNGQTAQKGTRASHESFSATMRSLLLRARVRRRRRGGRRCARRGRRLGGEFEGGLVGDVIRWPRFVRGGGGCWRPSWRRGFRRSARSRCRAWRRALPFVLPMRRRRARMSGTAIVASVRSWRGEKQRTRQRPRSVSARRRLAFDDVEFGCGDVGLEGGVIVFEDVGAGVGGCLCAAGARVAGAEIAGGIVGERRGDRGVFGLALPWALRAMRRDEHPLAAKRVVAAVRGVAEEVVIMRVVSASAVALRSTAPSTASTMYVSAAMLYCSR